MRVKIKTTNTIDMTPTWTVETYKLIIDGFGTSKDVVTDREFIERCVVLLPATYLKSKYRKNRHAFIRSGLELHRYVRDCLWFIDVVKNAVQAYE